MGNIYKGKIASISSDEKTARVLPLDIDATSTKIITIPWHLRGETGKLEKGTEVVYVEFEDTTGLLLGRVDGDWGEFLPRLESDEITADSVEADGVHLEDCAEGGGGGGGGDSGAAAEAAKTAEEAKEAAQNAQTAAETAQGTADEAKTAAGNAQTAAETAQKSANEAKTAADKVATDLSSHNTDTAAHSDLRLALQELAERVNAALDSDDETLDELSEIVAYIKSNKTLIDAITTSKVSVSDIVNDLVTNVSNRPLSAAQGVALKALIDALQTAVGNKANSDDLTAHTGNKSNPHKVTASQVGALPISGGTMTGPLVLTGGDAVSGVGNMQLDTNGQITAKGTTSTLFGRTAADSLLVGHASHTLGLRGKGSRPTYNGANVALQSDIPESGASGDIPTKTSELENDSGFITAADVEGKANKADIAATKYAAASNSAAIYVKISDFGAWGTGAWYQKGFSMLITSRAGETVWVNVSSDDSNTNAKAIRLLNTYTKIVAIYYSASESALYVKANAWCNNICAHLLTNINGDYVPTVAQASALASDAVEIPIVEFGAGSSETAIGNSKNALNFTGSATRPTYNSAEMALLSDLANYLATSGGLLTGNLTFPNLQSIKVTAAGTENTSPTYVATFSDNNAANGLSFSSVTNILGSRLAKYQASGLSNPNLATETGFYYINSSTNRPPFSQSSNIDYRILTTAYSSSWIQQIATDFRCDDIYYRRCQNGTWTSWLKVATQSDLDGKLSLNGGGTVVASGGDTALKLKSQANNSYINFINSAGTNLGYYGINASKQPVFYDSQDRIILHSGNYTNYVPKITSGTSDLTAGSSSLATGQIYLVYE